MTRLVAEIARLPSRRSHSPVSSPLGIDKSATFWCSSLTEVADREESKDPWKSLRIASWLELSGVWSDYYRMSANLLPPDLRDAPPMYFRTIGEVEKVKADIRAIGQDPDVVLGPSSKWPGGREVSAHRRHFEEN